MHNLIHNPQRMLKYFISSGCQSERTLMAVLRKFPYYTMEDIENLDKALISMPNRNEIFTLIGVVPLVTDRVTYIEYVPGENGGFGRKTRGLNIKN